MYGKGLIFGKRVMQHDGYFVAYDKKNGLKATIKMDCSKKSSWFSDEINRFDLFEGQIYTFNSKADFSNYKNRHDIVDREEKGKDIKRVLCKIKGSWLENLIIDDEEIWNINNQLPQIAIPSKKCLPSDWRYREDLLYINDGFDFKRADIWKVLLEEQQRKDLRLRIAYGKEHNLPDE